MDDARLAQILTRGTLDVEGRLVDASNATLRCAASLDGEAVVCVYKPQVGERPLWDFPTGTLGHREVASCLLAAAAGWDLVPPTVWREDGPAGPGMCQAWVDVDPAVTLVDVVPRGAVPPGWRDVIDAQGPGGRPVSLVHADTPDLRAMAVLDAIVNNADRKGGHVLVGDSPGRPVLRPADPLGRGRTWGIDHGVTFHEDDKLRTVLWGWAGDPLDPVLLDALDRLLGALEGPLGVALGDLLHRREVRATVARVHRLRGRGVFPFPGEGWPALPWPAF